MIKIQKPISIIYKPLTYSNPELINMFKSYLNKKIIEQLISKKVFNYTTNMFQKYYNKYKFFYENNRSRLQIYLQEKKEKLIYYCNKMKIDKTQRHLLVEYILPNYLLYLQYNQLLKTPIRLNDLNFIMLRHDLS